MGKLGRIACITTPMVLTVISFILLVVVFLGGWNKNDSNLSSLYYFKADTTGFKSNITESGVLSINLPGSADDQLRNFLNQLTSSNAKKNLSDIYEVYLWNYCSGSKESDGSVKLTYCSAREARYWFNPVEVWGLNNSGVADLVPKEIQHGLNIYKAVSNWMFVAYTIAFFATLANIIVGLLAICSRWGSCVTTIVSSVATLFTFLSALTSTILFSVLTGTFNSVLKTYGIKLSVGTKMMSVDWLAFAASLAATLFWTVSICCCSGKSDRKRRDGEKGYGGGKGYQPLGDSRGSYAQPPTNVEMSSFGAHGPYGGRETAYEPFRHS
ncbi:uncharacterized protein PV09_02040 [Verruconis gallopava]|uniref:Integral membrane protein n=1 Tax=Verruconis gallopava TaxID=253628 RepID=A0A0D1XWL1_9PEZI|nr:uncharacterized protein PV09_02040 [Verruconis gallopava]KIW07171.1 hypothetical protein PV09_02040 [Verruconis gallopava]